MGRKRKMDAIGNRDRDIVPKNWLNLTIGDVVKLRGNGIMKVHDIVRVQDKYNQDEWISVCDICSYPIKKLKWADNPPLCIKGTCNELERQVLYFDVECIQIEKEQNG
jgi:hypothetical protein